MEENSAYRHDDISDNAEEIDADVRALWGKFQGHLLARVDTIDRTLASIVEGRIESELLGEAERDAHKLAGSAGTFGHPRASVIASKLEKFFSASNPIEDTDLSEALSQAALLRQDLENRPGDVISKNDLQQLVLLVHRDNESAEIIAHAIRARGSMARVVSSVEQARSVLDESQMEPAIVVVALEYEGVLEFIRDLHERTPPIMVLGLTARAGFADRVEAVRAGIRGFLPDSLSPDELAEAAITTLGSIREAPWRILAIDDDSSLLAVLSALLKPVGMDVTTVTEPEQFWAVIAEDAIDLVILDLDMPQVNGIELCSMIRAHPRSSALPVLFLTSQVAPETVKSLFRAGADDYVAKPIVSSELIVRISNRLERSRVLRVMAETDPLTGLANRRKFQAQWIRLEAMANRYEQPLTFALLDLDHFRDINNKYGHEVGDIVLQRLSQMLLKTFRGEDVVARWGGEEIALALYGMDRTDSVRRVTDALTVLNSIQMSGSELESFTITFSAGISEYRVDGDALHDLCRIADERLYLAKELGRARVLPAV